jgi:hypothetical protein
LRCGTAVVVQVTLVLAVLAVLTSKLGHEPFEERVNHCLRQLNMHYWHAVRLQQGRLVLCMLSPVGVVSKPSVVRSAAAMYSALYGLGDVAATLVATVCLGLFRLRCCCGHNRHGGLAGCASPRIFHALNMRLALSSQVTPDVQVHTFVASNLKMRGFRQVLPVKLLP